jgi:hypothetical protein
MERGEKKKLQNFFLLHLDLKRYIFMLCAFSLRLNYDIAYFIQIRAYLYEVRTIKPFYRPYN